MPRQLDEIPRVPQLWYLDGARICGYALEIFDGLDWQSAWIDQGPSPAGNPGPYYKVPFPQEGSVHRLYPKRFALRMGMARLSRYRESAQ